MAARPKIVYIPSTAMNEDTAYELSDSNWGVSKAIIKTVIVDTTSTDWTFWIACDNSWVDGMFDYIEIGQNLSGKQVIMLDIPYIENDGRNVVHTWFTDNAGSTTCTVEIIGEEARTA